MEACRLHKWTIFLYIYIHEWYVPTVQFSRFTLLCLTSFVFIIFYSSNNNDMHIISMCPFSDVSCSLQCQLWELGLPECSLGLSVFISLYLALDGPFYPTVRANFWWQEYFVNTTENVEATVHQWGRSWKQMM